MPIILAILAIGAVALYLHHKNTVAAQAAAQPSSMAGLQYNPLQDIAPGTNLVGTAQETVDPLTGELILQPSTSQNVYEPNNPVSGPSLMTTITGSG